MGASHEERDCLIGLAPKYDAKETARQAAIEALQQRRFLDALDCAKVYKILCDESPILGRTVCVTWPKGNNVLWAEFFSRKNAERFAAHIGGRVHEGGYTQTCGYVE